VSHHKHPQDRTQLHSTCIVAGTAEIPVKGLFKANRGLCKKNSPKVGEKNDTDNLKAKEAFETTGR
jgi:hypothetical protein